LLGNRFDVSEMFSITPHFNRGLLRYVNAPRVRRLAEALGLGWLHRSIRHTQERMWLGWTIMSLATVRTAR